MKLVLDTKVFISAFVWGGKPKAVLERIFEGIDALYISRTILAELEEVLNKPKFGLDPERIAYFIRVIEETTTLVAPIKKLDNPGRDPADAMILECARAAGADCIVTGDEDLLVLDPWDAIRILTAADYLRLP